MDKRTLSTRQFALVVTVTFVLGCSLWTAVYFWVFADLASINSLPSQMVRPTTQILDRNGRLLYEVLDPNAGKQMTLTLDDVPQGCIQATLATEDRRFFQHPGVDLLAIARALVQNYRAGGEIVSGGSTVTQQVARNLLLDAEERYTQSIRRKLREAWLAIRLEQRYTKAQILAIYLNQTYYGNFAFGLEAASQVFFGKPGRQLSQAECALLAGLVQFPSGYNPLQEPDVAKRRQLTVLRLMREAGFITAAEETTIGQEPLRYRSQLFGIAAPHFVMYVQDLLVRQLGAARLRDGGLRITTSLDLDLQHAAEAAVRYRLELLNCRRPGVCTPTTDPKRRVDNAAAIVLDSRSGDILTMVGSPDYFDIGIQGNVNAALSLRQPGSAIKPLTYAAALDPTWSSLAGLPPLTPASIIADLPTTFYVKDKSGGNTPYTPLNYDRKAHGPVSVRTALSNSYNVPAVKVLDRIGVQTLKRIAAQAGITTFTGDFGLALTLGGGEVRLLELTAAFGMLDDGLRLDPRPILQIDDQRTQTTIWRASAQSSSAGAPPAVIAPTTAFLLTDILSDKIARVQAFGGRTVLDLPFPAAVKTGTTTDWRDNWTLGYSTQRVVGVWVGNADNTPMLDVSGIDGAGPIWHDLMMAAHAAPPPPFVRPDGIVEEMICAPSGLLPTPACPRTRMEVFIAGTEPQMADNQFQSIAIDRATNLRSTEATPAARVAERVFWLLPPEYHDWMVSQGIALAPPSALAAGGGALAASNVSEGRSSATAQALILTAPTSNTAFQLHPGLPRANQRIAISGYAADGEEWAELRLVVDGATLLQAANSSRLSGWWELQAGEHRFWLEGRRQPGSALDRSSMALVVVSEFAPVTNP